MTLVELIYDNTCPNFNKAKDNIIKAFDETKIVAELKEWERSAPESPAYARDFGSPTILVDGIDVSQSPSSDGAANCRIYVDKKGKLNGVPSVDIIVSALLRPNDKKSVHKTLFGAEGKIKGGRAFTVAPSFGIAALAPLACPACWPAYIGLLASMGIGMSFVNKVIFPLTFLLLILSVIPLWRRAKNQSGYGPFVLGTLAAVMIATGMFMIVFEPLLYGGVALLVTASAWNLWLGKKPAAGECPACVQSEGAS